MTRAEAINKGLIVASNGDHERNECLRKVPYTEFPVAFSEALRLAARSTQDGKRLKVYCCQFCGMMHVGNYTPSQRTAAWRIASLQAENRTLLGRISSLENELAQCRKSRDNAKSENGQLRASLAKKSLWQRIINHLRSQG